MKTSIPTVTIEQMREVDRLMTDHYGISLIQMMENAAIHLSRLTIKRFLRDKTFDKEVLIMAGRGSNGGGVLACARHLINKGVRLKVFLAAPESEFQGIPLMQLDILKALGVQIFSRIPGNLDADLIIDGLIGYGLKGNPKGLTAELISWCMGSGIPVLSLDIPSGMDGNTGFVLPPAIRSSATMTLALPKKGLFEEVAILQVGDLFLADIGVPPQLYEKIGIYDDKIRFLFKEKTLFKIF